MRVDRSQNAQQSSEVEEAPPASQTAQTTKTGGTKIENEVQRDPLAHVQGKRGVSPGFQSGTHQTADEAVADVKEALDGWWPRVDDAVAALDRLKPDEYARALAKLDGPLLDKLFEKASPEQKTRLVAQAEANGLITRVEGQKAPDVAGDPPDAPSLLNNDRKLPEPLRFAIQDQNGAAVSQYFADHKAYWERYEAQVYACKTPFELKAMGEPLEYMKIWEPGIRVDRDKELADRWRTVKPDGAGRPTDAYEAISAKTADFVGRQRAGTFAAKLEAEVGAELGTYEAKSKLSATATQYGTTKMDASSSIGSGPLALEVDHEGKLKGEVKAELGFADLSADTEGTLKLEAKAGPLDVGTEVNAKKGTMAASVGKEVDLGFVKAKVTGTATFQGANKEVVTTAVNTEGLFQDPMPELEARTPWSKIPEDRKKQFYTYGIDQKQWDAQVTKRR